MSRARRGRGGDILHRFLLCRCLSSPTSSQQRLSFPLRRSRGRLVRPYSLKAMEKREVDTQTGIWWVLIIYMGREGISRGQKEIQPQKTSVLLESLD